MLIRLSSRSRLTRSYALGLVEAAVDDLDAADNARGVLDAVQSCGEYLGAAPRREPTAAVTASDQLAASGQRVAGVKLQLGRDAVAVSKLDVPCVDVVCQIVPLNWTRTDSQGSMLW